ncbi:hypothetical protein PY365_09010 [Roseiarcaceae bacterium H3SJ34-1]|uniref:hypothetical protein n=1 Tax=Terripilifer ovatus TaxID=3032367 RepID=UPI003AB9B75A|nr:hypothetical protein [Roseiarcaceae bacterium H3SJ34-1]
MPFVRVGDRAEVADASRPERKTTAEVTRMTGELDPKSRRAAGYGLPLALIDGSSSRATADTASG